jgi:hypothetical protein
VIPLLDTAHPGRSICPKAARFICGSQNGDESTASGSRPSALRSIFGVLFDPPSEAGCFWHAVRVSVRDSGRLAFPVPRVQHSALVRSASALLPTTGRANFQAVHFLSFQRAVLTTAWRSFV